MIFRGRYAFFNHIFRRNYHEEVKNSIQRKSASSFHEDLGNQMKLIEGKSNYMINPNDPYVIRLDGSRFHVFTNAFEKPFDAILNRCLAESGLHLMKKFSPTSIYCFSDEVSLLFEHSALIEKHKLKGRKFASMFSGRVQKLASLVASLMTLEYNKNLRKALPELESRPNFKKQISAAIDNGVIFDCRVFNIPTKKECVDYFHWRYLDCLRNSKTLLASLHFSQKFLENKPANDLVQMLKVEKNIDWHKYPEEYRFGMFGKRNLVNRESLNKKTGELVNVCRAQCLTKCLPNVLNITEKLLFSSSWNEFYDETDLTSVLEPEE